jgi:hypothetical protein
MSNQANEVNLELLAKISETTKDINSYKKARKERKKQLGGPGKVHEGSFSDDTQLALSTAYLKKLNDQLQGYKNALEGKDFLPWPYNSQI